MVYISGIITYQNCMGILTKMPSVNLNQGDFQLWAKRWLSDINEITGKKKTPQSFDRQQSVNFAYFIDLAFGNALSLMLGNSPPIEVKTNRKSSLIPPKADCVEVGPVRIIGGVRPQNFDVAYRPDGPRLVFDSKTLNDRKSVMKNWQNMVNDLGTEATTIHTRFPYSIVVFVVVVPRQALPPKQEHDLILTLERLGTRKFVIDQPHLAESMSLLVWNPEDATICEDCPQPDSLLRIEKIPDVLTPIYFERYKGLPPHTMITESDELDEELSP